MGCNLGADDLGTLLLCCTPKWEKSCSGSPVELIKAVAALTGLA